MEIVDEAAINQTDTYESVMTQFQLINSNQFERVNPDLPGINRVQSGKHEVYKKMIKETKEINLNKTLIKKDRER